MLKNPRFLLEFNAIGPPSSLILKKEYYQKFDQTLEWLVDVENYYRIFKCKIRYQLIKNTSMSSKHNPNSITAKLKNINKIRKG